MGNTEQAKQGKGFRLLFNGLHSKSGGGLTYLNNILPIMADDRDVEVHLCVHEDQRESLPDNLENITVHTLNFKQGFWNLQVREQIDIPRRFKNHRDGRQDNALHPWLLFNLTAWHDHLIGGL